MRSNFRSFVLAVIFLVVLATSFSLTSCQRRTSLIIETGNPLRFVVSGPGTLTSLQVSGPDLDREPNREGQGDRLTLLKVYWELAPREGENRSLDQVGPITYGKVPEGFVQVQPPTDLSPPTLVERDLYNIRLFVKDDDGINRFFALRDGKVTAEGER